jgi:hypothetical protein
LDRNIIKQLGKYNESYNVTNIYGYYAILGIDEISEEDRLSSVVLGSGAILFSTDVCGRKITGIPALMFRLQTR